MKILMSVDRANKSSSMNASNRALFEKFLSKQGYEWEKVIGCYQEKGQDKPQQEQSYLIETHDSDDLKLIGQLFEQDSILRFHDVGSGAYLTSLNNGDVEYIGVWTKVSDAEAKANGHYTETNDGFFIAR